MTCGHRLLKSEAASASGRLLGKGGAALKNVVPRCECTAKVLKKKRERNGFVKEKTIRIFFIFVCQIGESLQTVAKIVKCLGRFLVML